MPQPIDRPSQPWDTETGPISAPFPARSKHASGFVNQVHTEVMLMHFADKILVTISQDGRLAHWVHVPLETSDPTASDRQVTAVGDGSELLPMLHLTASTIMGASLPARDILGQLYATQIASAIATKNPDERRLVVVGMGFTKSEASRESFLEVLDLMLQCI